MKKYWAYQCLALTLWAVSSGLCAQDPPPAIKPVVKAAKPSPADSTVSAKECPQETIKAQFSETFHSISIGDETVAYKATAGTLPIKGDDGVVKAHMFYVAYHKEGVGDLSARPLTFCFNGGPGSASLWLHMGILGPRRVRIDEEGIPFLPPQLVDNAYSLLKVTDLVFIDPVSAGYSRAAKGEDPKQFYKLEEDVHSFAQFITLFATRHQRWESPKFLAGESYGTMRAVGLAEYLQENCYMRLNGLMLISSILSFQLMDFSLGNDLPYLQFLPTYTSTAWFHGKLPPALQKKGLRGALKEAEDFALNAYATALLKGCLLSKEESAATAQKLSYYTGISADYLEKANLRLDYKRFVKELLRDSARTVGRFDSRFQGIDADAAGEYSEYDPSAEAIFAPFTSALNQYMRKELQWESDEPYHVFGNVHPWNYGKGAVNKYLSVVDTLREAMTRNPCLNVFIANGYYDLATPYFATDYAINHLGLAPALWHNLQMEYYEAGHMMYIHMPSLVKLSQDLSAFILKATAQPCAYSLRKPVP